MNKPQVSVIIPAHNGEAYLAEALESVLAQDYPHYDIVVVDNGSVDQTRSVVAHYPSVHYHCLDVASTVLARNRGIALAHGDYISFLDQDDVWTSDKLTRQVQFLEENQAYAGVVGLQKMYLQAGYQKPHWLKESFLDTPQMAYLPSALMVRRGVFDLTHFDTAFSIASDVAWFFKAKHQGISIGLMPEVVLHRRIHDDNTSHRYLTLQKEILGVIKSSLLDRRGANE